MGPSAYCLHIFPPVHFFAFNVLCWGILEMCMAATTSFGGLFVCRFLLGGFEALLIPAVTLLNAMWYKPAEQPARNAIILNVIAPILNGLVAWAVGYHKGDFPAWKIIFLTLGAFTVIWSAVVFFFLYVTTPPPSFSARINLHNAGQITHWRPNGSRSGRNTCSYSGKLPIIRGWNLRASKRSRSGKPFWTSRRGLSGLRL
jgi:MFS family permease